MPSSTNGVNGPSMKLYVPLRRPSNCDSLWSMRCVLPGSFSSAMTAVQRGRRKLKFALSASRLLKL